MQATHAYGSISSIARLFGAAGLVVVGIGWWTSLLWLCASGLLIAALVLLIPGRVLNREAAPAKTDDDGPLTRASRKEILAHLDRRYDDAERLDSLTGKIHPALTSKNAAFNTLIRRVLFVAQNCDDPILLLGPTGSGKTEMARLIYREKKARGRLTGRFIVVNCALLKNDQHLTKLVGHIAGSFTGATSSRAGAFALAKGGMVFFDEVGELSLEQQRMLLSILDEKMYTPYGADEPVEIDACFVFATLRDLSAMTADGTFGEDLLARIDTLTFTLPALADRPEDMEDIVEMYREISSDSRGVDVIFTPEARERWMSAVRHSASLWHDNHRGIAKSMTRLCLTEEPRIGLAAVEAELEFLRTRAASRGKKDGLEGLVPPEILGPMKRFDRVPLADVVQVCKRAPSLSDASRRIYGTPGDSAEASAADCTRLRRYLAKYELTFEMLSPRSA